MAYAVSIKKSAEKELGKFPQSVQQRIMDRIFELTADDARPAGSEKMAGHDKTYKIRIGDYRVVYVIDDSSKTVVVEAIGDRKEIYRRY